MLFINAERDLWIAVFYQALKDLTLSETTYERDARAWFLSCNQNAGSFIWVCQYLGIDPSAVRRVLWQSRFGSIEQPGSTPV